MWWYMSHPLRTIRKTCRLLKYRIKWGHFRQDHREEMPRHMFQCLTRFIEEECSPGPVDWYGNLGHKIQIDGQEKYVMDEMLDLYHWWINTYTHEYNEVQDILYAEIRNNEPIHFGKGDYWKPTFDNDDKSITWSRCMKAGSKLEYMQECELEKNMKRLIDVRVYMWT